MLKQDDNTLITPQKTKKVRSSVQVPISVETTPIICDCGKDITSLKPQQMKIHIRSKFNLNNI